MASGQRRLLAAWGVDAGLLLIRAMVGVVFVFHGAQKLFGAFGGSGIDGFAGFLDSLGFPLPLLNAWLAAGAEFVGGLALIVGLASRVSGLLLMFTMAVAVWVTSGNGFDSQAGGVEFPLLLAVTTFSLALTGPGRLAADAWIWHAWGQRSPSGRPAAVAAPV